MAYNIGDRFPAQPKVYLDPTSYQNDDCFKTKRNKAPFLSKMERITHPGNRIWTHRIYYADRPQKVPNCTSLMSKHPRFPYETLSKEDLDEILCRCGIQNACECSEVNQHEPEVNCQGKTLKRLFKGRPPKSAISEGLSVPSRRDYGFKELPDGTIERMFSIEKYQSPPFYDATIYESTAFYRGCKWSQRKASRAVKSEEERPGPADYTIEKPSTYEELCAEKVREKKRKTSKQLRFIEKVQERNISDGFPGPSFYNPQDPKSTDLKYLGSKAVRFQDSTEERPGPADYLIKRDFDPPISPLFPCHAILPKPSFFGVKATRFKSLQERGPSPATYSPNYSLCNYMKCPIAAFGSSSVRFKNTPIEDDIDFEIDNLDEPDQNETTHEKCSTPTWEFKSKTIRMPPLLKKQFEQSPEPDLPISSIHVERPAKLQHKAPFWSSEGRFQPWYDFIPVIARTKTPGPAYYNIEKPECQPSVCQGPVFRTKRFPKNMYQSPAPNEYNVGGGVESILATHNQRLKNNIENQHKFHWAGPMEPKFLSLEERETIILNKAIQMLEIDDEVKQIKSDITEENDKSKNKPKLLRCFLYSKPYILY